MNASKLPITWVLMKHMQRKGDAPIPIFRGNGKDKCVFLLKVRRQQKQVFFSL